MLHESPQVWLHFSLFCPLVSDSAKGRASVLYRLYQRQSDMMWPMRMMAQTTQAMLGWPHRTPRTRMGRRMSAVLELVDRFTLSHERPEFAIGEVICAGRPVRVTEHTVQTSPPY
jgi:poly(3-hydroxybutyrate) depolymerase